MSWIDTLKVKTGIGTKIAKPEVIWVECKGCGDQLYIAEVEKNFKVCPSCDYHFRVDARERISQLINPGTFVEYDQDLISTDPLKFKDKKKYKDTIRATKKKGTSLDALIAGSGILGDHPVEISIFEFKFMGGSMGSVVGEKITRSIERAIENKTPMIIVSCSGGARMQEGIYSLMQMAKTSAALRRLAESKLPYISILTDPTTGGVSASFAMLGDVILAEPGALIGFAGPRVIEQTIQQKLPEGFQRAEFLLDHGLIDGVVHRKDLKKKLENLLSLFANKPIPQLTAQD
jgi:acetyl-CoA carboxylase carboxyl transferase subunit beta